jgi:hypothetical protein
MIEEQITRRAVEDGSGNMVKVGDAIRHMDYGRDATVTATYTQVMSGTRFNMVAIDQPGGPWAPERLRKL